MFVIAVLGALCLCACEGGSENGSKTGGSGSVSKASDSGRVLSLEDGRKAARKFSTGKDINGNVDGLVNNPRVCTLFTYGLDDTPSLYSLLSNAFEPDGNLPLAIRGLHVSLGRSDGELHSKFIDLAAPFEAEFMEMEGKGVFDFDEDYVSSAVAGVVDACNKIEGW